MKLGIAGSGNIVKEFLSIANRVPDLEVIGICARNRSEQRARRLARQYGIRFVELNYDNFLKIKEIDTIYVAVTNDLHYEYAKKALMAGKNCIVEKPFTLTYAEAKDLYRVAGRKDRFLFEAISSLFTKGFEKMKEGLPKLGKLRMVEANYSQYSTRYEEFKNGIIKPSFDAEKGGGALYDLNIYNLHLAYALFGKPAQAIYYGNKVNDVDTSGVAILKYPDFICSLIAAKDSFNDPYFNIQGDEGVLIQRTSANICGPFEIEDTNQEVEYFDGKDYHVHRLVNEFTAFVQIIKDNDLYRYDRLQLQTLGVMELVEQLRENTVV